MLEPFRPTRGAHTAPQPVLRRLEDYTGEPLCDRCANHYPVCADTSPDGQPYTHEETCATYTWANALCNNCEKELTRR